MKNTLIVYYSFSDTTKHLAQLIANNTKGDLLELIPEKPYSFDYNTAAKEVRIEIEKGYCPKLKNELKSVNSYDYIFIGSPNWFKSFAPPILTFLKNVDLTGKTIIPFCTHGGGGFGQIEKDIIKECPNSKFISGLESTSSIDINQVKNYIEKAFAK